MQRFLILLAAFTMMWGCGKANESYQADEVKRETAETANPAMGAPMKGERLGGADSTLAMEAKVVDDSTMQPVVYTQRQVIRNAEIGVRVKAIEDAEKAATKLVREAGGYVEGTTSSDLAGDNPEISMTARIPVARFDDILQSMVGLGVATSKTISGVDVTSQIVDLDAQLKNLGAQETSYREMLKGARSTADILSLRDKLDTVRMNMDRLSAQRKETGGLAALSTIKLTLSQSLEAMPVPAKDQGWAQETLARASGTFMGAVKTLAVVVIWTLVYSPIWLPLAILIRYFARLARRRTA